MNRLIIIAALLLLPLQALAVGTGPNLFSSGGLLSGCADQQVMTWIDANSAWECADPPGASGGEANRLASPDVGAEVDVINTVPLTGVNLNLKSFEADHFTAVANIISIDAAIIAAHHAAVTALAAGAITFTPDAAGEWGTPPAEVDAALEDLAPRVTANDAKTTNATHSGDVSGSGALTIGADKVLESHLKSVNAATDEYCLTYESTTGDFEWEVCGAGGGDVATDAIWDAKGDLAGGTGADTAAKLTVGANDSVLLAASGEATGMIWDATPAIDCTDCTNIPAGSSHTGTVTWSGTSVLESGAAFGFGDGTDATLTHTYANTGTDVTIAYSTGNMTITGDVEVTSLGDQGGSAFAIDTAGDATFNSVAVSASATPNLLLIDSTTSGEGKIEVSDAAGPESEMQFWVDEGTGTATEYMTLDGVGETIDLLKPVDITGVTTIGNGTSPGDVRILEGSGGGANYVSIIAPATLASNRICTLEDDDTPFDGCITSGGGMTSWNLDGDNTDPQTITNTNTALIAGTAPISTVAAATDTVTVSLDANGVDASHLAATLTMGATDLVDFTAWENTDANGLIAPTAATSCANVATEGQVCWEADADALWVGDGAAPPTQIGAGGSGDVTDVGDCAGPACFTSGSPDAALTFNNATSGTVTLQTVAGALGTVTASLPAETGTILTSASTIDATSVETTLIRDVEIDIGAGAWTLNATTPPTESTIGTTFVRDILNFDYQTADNNVSIEIEIPTIYDNTVAPTLNVVWSSTAITGDVCWCAEATSVIDSGDNTPTPPASDCTSTLVDGTTTDRNETSITLAGGDFVAGGGGLIHLFRDQDESETGCGAGDDDMAAVASLHSAKLTFQVSE